jgi:hypothetical protein
MVSISTVEGIYMVSISTVEEYAWFQSSQLREYVWFQSPQLREYAWFQSPQLREYAWFHSPQLREYAWFHSPYLATVRSFIVAPRLECAEYRCELARDFTVGPLKNEYVFVQLDPGQTRNKFSVCSSLKKIRSVLRTHGLSLTLNIFRRSRIYIRNKFRVLRTRVRIPGVRVLLSSKDCMMAFLSIVMIDQLAVNRTAIFVLGSD